ncbi:spindle pole body formation-associated protein-domain-containing protein [Xylaria sp. FL1042]|nr:spindle pole body formation-associated protein-domain-containing protein [Xylaria sp. FL1042]
MLGWALKKGFQGATGLRDAPEGGEDTTQFDAPDTPAPVFAARAIKNAIWGQSATTEDHPSAKMKPTETERVKPTQNATAAATTSKTATAATTTKETPDEARSPTKLNSILLTPGTGTSRRKRVSFGRDVKAGNNVDSSPFASSSARNGRSRKKTTLQQALENSRPAKSKEPEPQPEAPVEEEDTEEEWEWEDDDICCNHDVTVDLNEPHSESGKYWKAEWSRYREEAKSDIEQLVKYKANARSYAAKKDMEASELSQKLKDEQTKVAEMEKKMADMTTKLAATRRHGTNKDTASMADDLARQTSLVVEYRERVKELETRLADASSKSNLNHPSHQRIDTSPRTEQNILEVSRELRKARSELRQLDRLRDEVKRLKSNLATSRERVAELEAQASLGETTESSRVAKLETQLRGVREESRQKDAEIRKFKREYESLKRDAKSRTAEAMQVLQDKNVKIERLEGKIKDLEKDLEAARSSKQPKGLEAATSAQNKITRDLKSGIQSLGMPSKYEKTRPINQRARAASVEDITLDMTQRSLLRERDDHLPYELPQEKPYDTGLSTDWTADIPTFELEVRDNKKRHEAKKPDEELILEDVDALPSRQTTIGAEQQSLHSSHGAVSDVLSNRVNESSRRQSRRNQRADMNDVLSAGRDQSTADGRIATERTASVAKERSIMHGALHQSTRRPRFLPRSTRPVSPGGDTPAIDLVRDQFTRLGGPSADRSALGNTSRCTLPAERQAAARARLEQKRMERRKASGRVLDKENVRP